MSKDGGGSKTRGLYILLGILCVAIIGLGVGIYFVVVNNVQVDNEIIEELGGNIAICTIDSSSEGCDDIVKVLEEISNSDSEDEYIQANILKAGIIGDENEDSATEILNSLLEENISDKNRYNVLRALLRIYKNNNDKENCIKTMRLLIELPDSMKLELEDWALAKQALIMQLNEMENNI